MFGRTESDSPRRNKRNEYGLPYNMTPGQTFDLADVGFESVKNFRGSGGNLGWNTGIFGALYLGISTGTAPPEEILGRSAGSVAAISTGIAGYYAGRAAGSAVGG